MAYQAFESKLNSYRLIVSSIYNFIHLCRTCKYKYGLFC